MFGQTFDLVDIPRLLTLAFIELLLSSDNAIVLALLAHALPERLRKKALFIGIASSFILRAAALFTVSILLRYHWIQLLGAAYLFYVSIHHFAITKRKPYLPKPTPSFWKTVLMIELFDLAFAIDSIVAGIVFIGPAPAGNLIHPKLWIVYSGGMLGLLGIRYAANLFTKLLSRFPRLETSAYLMIAWIGLKLAATSIASMNGYEPFFWLVLAAIFLLGLRKKNS